MTTDIVLFDIATKLGSPISPHGWKVRLAMNYKGLQFKTRFVSGTDIEKTCKPLGILPTGVKPNGMPHYTLPAILDRTNPEDPVALSDSLPILEYLERAYPSNSDLKLFPPGTHALQVLFNQSFILKIIYFMPHIAAQAHIAAKVDEDSEEFRGRLVRLFGKPVDQIEKKGAEREAAYAELEGIFKQLAVAIGEEGPFLMGERIVAADFALAGCIVFIKSLSPEEAYARLRLWHDGRWARYFDAFAPYMTLDSI